MLEEARRTDGKPMKSEVRRRIDIAESLLIECASVTDTLRYFKEKENLVLGRRTVERYRTMAERRIVKAAESMRQVEIATAKSRLERCFARAMTGGKKNVFAAIAAQKAINAMLGLNAPKEQVLEMVTRIEEPAKKYAALYDGRKIEELSREEFEEVRRGMKEYRITLRDDVIVSTTDPAFLQEMHNEFKSMLEERLREGELDSTLKEMGYRLKSL